MMIEIQPVLQRYHPVKIMSYDEGMWDSIMS